MLRLRLTGNGISRLPKTSKVVEQSDLKLKLKQEQLWLAGLEDPTEPIAGGHPDATQKVISWLLISWLHSSAQYRVDIIVLKS